MAVVVRTPLPVFVDDPVECPSCGVVWPASVLEERQRYMLALDPRLCTTCAEKSRAVWLGRQRSDAHRCQCLGCAGHEGGCTERVYGVGRSCRACVQWASAVGKFKGSEHSCARCYLGTKLERLICGICEAESARRHSGK